MICVFLDSNILHSKSTDFTKARFAEKLEELIGEIEVNDLYTYVKLVIPQLVISELRRQQIDDCSEVVRTLRKIKVTNQVIELPQDYEKICDLIFDETLDRLHDGTVKVDVAPYPPNEVLQGLIQRAISKDPPFEGKEKESDKGFKDALIWESLLDYKRLNPKNILVLYSRDTRITDTFLAKEYTSLFNETIHMIYRSDSNSHRQLLDKLRELSDIEEDRATFAQQLRDRLISIIQELPPEYIFEASKTYELDGDHITIDSCYINGISILDEVDDEGIITFYLSLNIAYSFRDAYGGFGNIDHDSNATINYILSEDLFYLQGIEDLDGSFGEFPEPGLEL